MEAHHANETVRAMKQFLQLRVNYAIVIINQWEIKDDGIKP